MSVIGTLKRSEKGNIFTWVLSRDISLLLNNDIVISNEFYANVDQKFNLEFHKGHINGLSDFHEISNMILGKAPLVVEQCEN
ncbi:hypothetical protein TKK_0012692 [Trichogramma kaykai]